MKIWAITDCRGTARRAPTVERFDKLVSESKRRCGVVGKDEQKVRV